MTAPVKQAISSPDAPSAIGAYSPAIRAGNLLFVSGQVPMNPAAGTLVDGDITAQTEQVMRNLSALLKAAGAGFQHVVKTTGLLAAMNDLAEMNGVYGKCLGDPRTARGAVR